MGTANRRRVFIGLTDDSERARRDHGLPADWQQIGPFPSEADARKWQRAMLADGFVGEPGGKEWKYAYWYTIRQDTVERGDDPCA